MTPGLTQTIAERSLSVAATIADRAVVPDQWARGGIRRLLRRRLLKEGSRRTPDERAEHRRALIEQMRAGPISIHGTEANNRHYEMPPEFFELALGPRRKYSSCHFGTDADLADAEDDMLRRTCENARLLDGMRVLDLGCGWGSLSLFIAEQYSHCRVTAVSNSQSQGDFVRRRAAARGLSNVEVITADINDFSTDKEFDRIISVEMFEHLRNWPELLRRTRSWLDVDGRVLIHVFCHRELAYLFEPEHPNDWMSTHFFTGGLMPSDDLLATFDDDLKIEAQWRYNGRHYAETCDHWLANVDAHRDVVLNIFKQAYGENEAGLWLQRWRLFFMACSELFGYADGNEWYVSHYRLAPLRD